MNGRRPRRRLCGKAIRQIQMVLLGGSRSMDGVLPGTEPIQFGEHAARMDGKSHGKLSITGR